MALQSSSDIKTAFARFPDIKMGLWEDATSSISLYNFDLALVTFITVITTSTHRVRKSVRHVNTDNQNILIMEKDVFWTKISHLLFKTGLRSGTPN